MRCWKKPPGSTSALCAPELNNLAALYQRQQRYGDAEPLFKRALALREKSLTPGHPDIAQSLNNLATLYEKQDRHTDSEPLFKRALAIYQKAAGPEHPAVATLLNNLGQVDKVQGRTADAESEIRRSLAIREKVLGRDILESDPSLGRAEALRRATLGYLNDASRPQNAYPALWGPSALIGEGAAR